MLAISRLKAKGSDVNNGRDTGQNKALNLDGYLVTSDNIAR